MGIFVSGSKKLFIDILGCRCYTDCDNRIANELSVPIVHTGDSTPRPPVTIDSSCHEREVTL